MNKESTLYDYTKSSEELRVFELGETCSRIIHEYEMFNLQNDVYKMFGEWLNMEYKEWLKQLKVGDEVIYHAWGFGSYYDLAKVERITPTGFIRVNGTLFKPDTGYARNCGACIRDPNEDKAMEALKEYNKAVFVSKTMRRIRNTNMNDVTYEQAVEMAKIMGWKD